MKNPNGPYPGRQIFLGRTKSGKPCFAYFVSGRSPKSRERKATPMENDVIMGPIGDEGYDWLKHYTAIKYNNDTGLAVVTNGIQTQAIYEPSVFAKFMKRAEQFKVPILAGVIPLKSAGMARFMNKNVSGVFVPEEFINKMVSAEDKVKTGLEIAADLIKQLKDMCQGIHVMAIGWEKKVPTLLELAGI